MKILITSGGTKIHIDDVRYISNNSSGNTGAQIAKQALINNHKVVYMHSIGAMLPFKDSINIDLSTIKKINIEKSIQNIKTGLELYNSKINLLENIVIKDFYDYKKQFINTLKNNEINVVILSMAASDYGIEKIEGKIPSNNENISLKLKKLPKIINLVKKIKPEIILVGFKLLTYNYGENELLEAAKQSLKKNNLDLIVANIVSKTFKPIKTFIIDNKSNIFEVKDRKLLAKILIETIENNINIKN